MAWFRNHYFCDRCDEGWTDEWFCGCDDECPSCGKDFTPENSEELLSDEEQLRAEGGMNLGRWVIPGYSWGAINGGPMPIRYVQRADEDLDSFIDRVLNS
jgi:hypothetical protein